MNPENTGIRIINWSQPETDRQKTVVVLGISRSGTTMIAQLLTQLGVHMGSNLDSVVYEDKEIRELMESRFSARRFQHLVEKRNAEHSLWGWKVPKSIHFVREFERYLSEPHYIFVFRDVLSVSLRNEITLGEHFTHYMYRALSEYRLMSGLISETRHPALLVSYEKAIANPMELVKTLGAFLGKKLSEQQSSLIASSVVPNRPEYVHSIGATLAGIAGDQSISGYVNFPGNGIITGWIMDKKFVQRTLYVNIFCGSQFVATLEANTFRQDLYELKLGTGQYGFEIDLKEYLDLKASPVQISVFHAGQPYYQLGGSPLPVYW